MPNFMSARGIGGRVGGAPGISAARSSYSKVNADRQSRHQARQWRRDGNWDILGLPTAMLWLDEMCAASVLDPEVELECQAPGMTGLWP